MGRWAARSPGHDPTLPLSGVSIMLSFTAMLDAERAKGFAGTVAFRFGEMVYVARVASGAIEIRRGAGLVADRGRPEVGQAVPIALHPAAQGPLSPTVTGLVSRQTSPDGCSK